MRKPMSGGCRRGRTSATVSCRRLSGSMRRVPGRPVRSISGRRFRRTKRTTMGTTSTVPAPRDYSARRRSGRRLSGERVRPARHARQRAGVGGGLLARQLPRCAAGRAGVDGGRKLWPARAARRFLEQQSRGTSAPRTASGTRPATASTAAVSASPGRFPLESFLRTSAGVQGRGPWRVFWRFALSGRARLQRCRRDAQ